MSAIDYRNPNYAAIFERRAKWLKHLEQHPEKIAWLKTHYKTHPWLFINDWGMAFEPRNIAEGLITTIPLILWGRQIDYLKWVYVRWQKNSRGLVEKSRDCGVTWLSIGFAASMWSFWDGFTVGFGSRKEELVDKKGDPDSIFEKLRFFIENIPKIFRPPGFSIDKHAPYMRLINPVNGATIKGEAGDNIGRGGRSSIYFVDEAAFIEHQDLVDAALSQTTNCQIDISTPNGSGNAFFRKRQRFDKSDRVFIFDWRDDPRKDQAWYDAQVEDQDEVIVAQEIDRDYAASQEGAFIPAKWVAAAIDAHKLLGFEPEGIRVTALDPADVGDAKALANRYGSVILEARELREAAEITDALPIAFHEADEFRADVLVFDADGMGAPSMKLALQHRSAGRMEVVPYHGSAGVHEPGRIYGSDEPGSTRSKAIGKRTRELHEAGSLRTNQDLFENYRAQTWTWARDRFRKTYAAVQRARNGQIVNADPDSLISISSDCTHLTVLQSELSRPKRLFRPNGKILVEAKHKMRERGVQSPNLADGVIMSLSIRQSEHPHNMAIDTMPWAGDDYEGGGSWMG